MFKIGEGFDEVAAAGIAYRPIALFVIACFCRVVFFLAVRADEEVACFTHGLLRDDVEQSCSAALASFVFDDSHP